MSLPKKSTAEDFAEYIARHKPYLIEIEDEIQNAVRQNLQTTVKVTIHVRGGNVVQLEFWNRRHWKRNKNI